MDDCDYENALKDIYIGIELDPNDLGLLYGRGRIKIWIEDYEGALEILGLISINEKLMRWENSWSWIWISIKLFRIKVFIF